eukprot:TRINITY_DN40609_c0_g1_i2.p1 TRINITY_DN40609_c0_g1~~TRINITY_DN40609_c0_g1_i2.p1  ORF type:complete len:172 (-),score=34.84 TRINITY_DN40609_c0_g1_i2:868-1383(-)
MRQRRPEAGDAPEQRPAAEEQHGTRSVRPVLWQGCVGCCGLPIFCFCFPLLDIVVNHSLHTTPDSELHRAAKKGNIVRFEELLLAEGGAADAGKRLGYIASETSVYAAAKYGHTAVLKALLDSHADPRLGKTVGPSGMLSRVSPLFAAAGRGHSAAVAMLLERGALPDEGM